MKNYQFWFHSFISRWKPVNSWSRSKFIDYGFSILMGLILIKLVGSWSRLVFNNYFYSAKIFFWLNQWRRLCCEAQLEELILWWFFNLESLAKSKMQRKNIWGFNFQQHKYPSFKIKYMEQLVFFKWGWWSDYHKNCHLTHVKLMLDSLYEH
jgi:hypothetical protein